MSGRRLPLPVIVASPAIAVLVSLVMDTTLLMTAREAPAEIIVGALLFNGAAILQASVGALIEVRRPAHRVGRLLMVTGPLYALVSAMWLTGEELEVLIGTQWAAMLNALGAPLSYMAVALFAAGVPLLFPTGSLPGRRWRLPTGFLGGLLLAGMVAGLLRPGPLPATTAGNPFGVPGWPPALRVLEELVPVALVGLIILGLASQVVRYRRGTATERLQVRWLVAAVAVVLVGFLGVFVEQAIRTDSAPLASAVVMYLGILLMPVAIGIAILRYRLYEIDRLVSRTIGWAIVTGLLVAVFAGLVVGLQAILPVAPGNTLVVAVSTLVAFALFQPLRRRVQHAVDRRFDRGRYDGERTAAAFAERLRDEVDLSVLQSDLVATAVSAVRPERASMWLRSERDASRGFS